MTLMTRTLNVIGKHGVSKMRVDISAPAETAEGDYVCQYQIGWPEQPYAGEMFGIDAIQALGLTLNVIANRLYTSSLHKEKRLSWEKIGDGYGFPLSASSRELAEGSDKLL